jgi:hypothetical protein
MFTRRELLDAAKCHFGGGTSSNPIVPPEFAPLINASVGNMVGQQGANPIGAYNGANPMGVEGLNGSQQFGMGGMMGSYENNPLQYLAAQAAQRSAGMAGGGASTGSYDSSGEMGLQDWADYMKPYLGTGGEMGNQQAPNNQFNDGSNVTPQGVAGVNNQGGAPNMSLPPPGAGVSQTLGGSPASSAAGSGGANTMPGMGSGQSLQGQFYQDPSGGFRMSDLSQAGRIEGTGVHGQGAVDANGMVNQFFHAASQGQGPGQLGAGSMSARPTDPAMAAAWDNIMKNHPGASVGTQQAQAPSQMSMQDVMANPAAHNYASHLVNRDAEGQAYQQHQGWAEAGARAEAARAAAPKKQQTASVKAQA